LPKRFRPRYPHRHTTPTPNRRGWAIAASLALAVALTAVPSTAIAGSGGTGPGGGGDGASCKSGSEAKISDGKAIAPCSAPGRVQDVIAAANKIAKGKSYCYGGGHQSWRSSCYDCSGSVSFALHGGGLIDSPMDSSGLMGWGSRGKGEWITVFANSGHAYAVIAGLRFDTSMTAGAGPGWSAQMRSSDGYVARHRRNL
jgi:hypothetical protein